MVADALSHMTVCSVSHVDEVKKDLVKKVHWLARLFCRLEDFPNCGFMVHHNSKLYLMVEVMSKQHLIQPMMELKMSVIGKFNKAFSLGGMES